MDINTTNRTK